MDIDLVLEGSQQLLLFAVVLLGTGLVAGFLAGLLGVGGGIVIVPVLFNLFDLLGFDESITIHLAVGTSLATIIPTSIRSLNAHAKKGAVDANVLKSWAPGMIVGVIVGAAIAGYVDSRALIAVFAVVALLVALHMAFGRDSWRFGDRLPRGASSLAMSGGVGAISTMMGIGGGTLGVPIMTLFGFPPARAVATASGFGLIISIPATMGFIWAGQGATHLPPGSFGYVNLIGVAIITPMTILAAPYGAHFAHALPKKRLKQAFAFFLALTSLRMFASLYSL